MGALFLTALALFSLDEVREPRLTDYLTKVAAKVAPGRQFKFVAFEDPRTFLEPRYLRSRQSTTIQVPISLMRVCQSEAELAAILAHTIAHIENPYIRRTATPGGPEVRWEVSASDPTLTPLSWKPFIKAKELEADASTLAGLIKAGYDPEAVVSLLHKLPTSEFNDEVRRSAARDAIADLQVADDLKVDTSDFAQFRKVLEELPSAQQVRRKSGPPTLRRASEK